MQKNVYVPARQYERSDFPSDTIPDQAFTMAEIMARHAKGMLTDTEIQRYGEYGGNDHDDVDMEKLGRADMVDKSEYLNEVSENIREQKEAFAASRKQRDAKPDSKEEVAKPEPVKPEKDGSKQ